MEAIRTEKLSRKFDSLTALDELTLSVQEGEIFGLVGPDGAGKTTTMRLLTAIMDPTSGDAWVNGRHVVKEAEAIKHEIGYMSQRFGLYPDLTVMENIDFYADIYREPRKGRAGKIERLLSFSNLTPFKNRLAGDLSGGMKQKLGIACALIHTPKILFLDEPTNGVDPVSRRDFWRILYRLLKDRVTIFLSTAYLDEAERCNRIALIDRGRLVACGTPDEVKRLMKGSILELQLPGARDAARKLGETLDEPIALYGSRIHITTSDAAGTLKRVKAALGGAHAKNLLTRNVPPSLEDVFTSVLSDSGGPNSRKAPAASIAAGIRHAATVAAPEAPAVAVHQLERRFGSFVAVNRISFQVARGEVFGFLGPNGAGKSTTIRMLCGILEPSSGSGKVAGLDIREEAEHIKANIGYMSQKFSLYEDLTVEENIDFYGGIYGLKKAHKLERKDWVIEMAGLKEHRRSKTAVLSTGWKQRLALGCAIMHEPSIIFLDEPTSGVDPISRRRFWDLIYEMSGHGVTVFVTTHYMDEAEYCDRLGLIYAGELIACDTPDSLKSKMMQEAVLEVRCDRPQEAMYEIEKIEAVREVALFGLTMHVVTADTGAAIQAIRSSMRSAGFGNLAVEQITPSMEDVFVSLIETHDRTRSPQQEVRQ
ncbi:MAG: ABC transporter ATP-binding protein [Verrucomicrobia bacterium]|nr:ABC transporter ATP-binding protein [Verrucomicrobiota bacterium]